MTQVAVNSQIWNFQEIGNGKATPILILHGWGRSGNEWIPMANELSVRNGRKVYVIDLPGFGGSSLPRVSSIVDYSKLVADFLVYLDLDKVVILGHSLGGRVGIVLGAMHPNLVERLILIDPAGVKPKSLKRVLLQVIAKIFAWVPPTIRTKIIANMMDEDYRSSPALATLYRSVVGKDLRIYLPSITCPTTVVWGEHDPILPLALTKIYQKKLSDNKIRVVWGAGHDPHLSHPRQLDRILEEVWT